MKFYRGCKAFIVKRNKGIWRHHTAEWLEYKEGAIKLATRERAEREIELYRGYILKMLDAVDEMKEAWFGEVEPAHQTERGA